MIGRIRPVTNFPSRAEKIYISIKINKTAPFEADYRNSACYY